MNRPVWVVDDVPAVANSLTALLLARGVRAEAMFSGTEALSRLEDGEEPRVLVLDLNMPGRDGNSVLEEIMRNPHWTFPVIIYTGERGGLRKSVSGRVFRTLSKNGSPLELLQILSQATPPDGF